MSERRLNIYSCLKCNWNMLSEDIDEGVTPFMMPCRCGGDMYSNFYKIDKAYQYHPADIKWYKPTNEEISKLTKEMKEHVDNGGLCFKVNNPRITHLETKEQFK